MSLMLTGLGTHQGPRLAVSFPESGEEGCWEGFGGFFCARWTQSVGRILVPDTEWQDV